MNASLYPLFLNLRGRLCVVIGGSEIAEAKVQELLDAGARVRLIARTVTDQIASWFRAGRLHWEPRPYKSADLNDAFLVVSIAGPETNARVFEEAELRHTFSNAVDDVPHCNCYASAVVRRGPLQIAISTAGNSPALARRLRKQLEEGFGQEYAPWVRRLGDHRRRLLQDKGIDNETRRRMLHEQASASAFEDFRESLQRQSNG
jgi:precorrin-2 dehydrogenase/sirohydrochlorin ferrochelatase